MKTSMRFWLAVIACGTAHYALGGVADAYLDQYLAMFPTRATQAGNHSFDNKLEDFSPERLQRWVRLNESERDRLTKLLKQSNVAFDDRLDAEALLAQVEREVHEQTELRRPQRDPLYWSDPVANAAVFLLVRDDLPLADRQQRVRERARLLPAFARQCGETLARAPLDELSPELCKIAMDNSAPPPHSIEKDFQKQLAMNRNRVAKAKKQQRRFRSWLIKSTSFRNMPPVLRG